MTAAFFDDRATADGACPAAVETDADKPFSAKPVGAIKEIRNKGADRGAVAQTVAALVWVPQAALLARAVGAIAVGGGIEAVIWPALSVLVLGFLRAGVDAIGGRMAFRGARTELTALRQRAATALARRSPIDAGRPPSGLAASLIAEQAEMIVPFRARFQPAQMKAIAVPVVLIACVLSVSWLAAIILLLTAPLIPIFMALIGWRTKAASKKHLQETGGINAFLLDRLRGLATIRALDAVDATAVRLRVNAETLRQRTMAVLNIAFLSSAVLELFAALGVASIAVYVGFSLLGSIGIGTWGGPLSLSGGLFILLLAPAFFEPLRELSAVWHDRASGETALEALDALSADGAILPGALNAEPVAVRPRTGPLSVRVEGLRFRHTSGRMPVFDGFDLKVCPGEHVALMGESGSGKTTLLSLIAGLAPHEAGRILIGDELFANENAASLRRHMIWISQRAHIFAGSLRSNVALGRPLVDGRVVADAIDRMQLHQVALTQAAAIGEGGLGLSGGEALRLTLARAAVNAEASILLADEPTAHLDAGTALAIANALLSLARGRTLIVATHDPVLAGRMDRVIHLGSLRREVDA